MTLRAPVYREVFCDEDDDRLWNRYCGIGSGANNRSQHARSSFCPLKLCASLHGSCHVRQRRGESALCPSCGAPRGSPHRSPDSPPPLLNREDDGRRGAGGHKTTVKCIKWLQARACSHPLKHPGSTFIGDALWRAQGSGVKCATYFCHKLGWRTGRVFCAYEETGFAKHAECHEANL